MSNQAVITVIAEKTGIYLRIALSDQDYDLWMRGWLLDPETLKKVFGRGLICVDCYKSVDDEDAHPTCSNDTFEKAWFIQGQQLVPLSLDEIIRYYGEYLGIQD